MPISLCPYLDELNSDSFITTEACNSASRDTAAPLCRKNEEMRTAAEHEALAWTLGTPTWQQASIECNILKDDAPAVTRIEKEAESGASKADKVETAAVQATAT
jgi:hypothetical protein